MDIEKLSRRFPVYSRVLRLYPVPYRERYTEQMLQTTADMLDGVPDNLRLRLWVHIVLELPGSIVHQRLIYATQALMHETPTYVRRNTMVSALLMVPFCAIAVINDMTGHSLYQTWFWSYSVLLTWILLLPALSLIISGTTFISWLYGRKKQGSSLLRSIKDIRHNWAMLALSFLGFVILGLVFFHDSVRCVAGDPVREVDNSHQTIRCIEDGSVTTLGL